jgi:hypothetical protein
MKKILFVLVFGSFLGLSLNANACDGHKAKAKKASTTTVTGATKVSADAKKECTPAEKAACADKAKVSKASTKAGGCCAHGSKKATTTTTEASTTVSKKGS